MTNCGRIKSTTTCNTQECYIQSCWGDYIFSRSVETFVSPAMHSEFHFHGNSEAPTDQTITSTWAVGVGLSRQWPVPHTKAIISHVEMISFVAEESKPLFTPEMHSVFYFHGYSEAPTDQNRTSTWELGVGLNRQWPVPHNKAIISHVEVISLVAEASKLSFLQQCIENFKFQSTY